MSTRLKRAKWHLVYPYGSGTHTLCGRKARKHLTVKEPHEKPERELCAMCLKTWERSWWGPFRR